jgi:hypothetical protein
LLEVWVFLGNGLVNSILFIFIFFINVVFIILFIFRRLASNLLLAPILGKTFPLLFLFGFWWERHVLAYKPFFMLLFGQFFRVKLISSKNYPLLRAAKVLEGSRIIDHLIQVFEPSLTYNDCYFDNLLLDLGGYLTLFRHG